MAGELPTSSGRGGQGSLINRSYSHTLIIILENNMLRIIKYFWFRLV